MSHPPLLTLLDVQPVAEAIKLIASARLSGAPVLNSDGALVGIVSESDLLWREAGTPAEHWRIPPVLLLGDIFSWRDTDAFRADVKKIFATRVDEVMTPSHKLISVQPNTTLQEAARLMCRHGVSRLPVLNENSSTLAGLLSRSDIVRALSVFEIEPFGPPL